MSLKEQLAPQRRERSAEMMARSSGATFAAPTHKCRGAIDILTV